MVGEFGEEVFAGVDGVLAGVGDGVLEVVVGHVEVAADGERDGDTLGGEGGADGGEAAVDAVVVVSVDVVGVGRGDDVGDAVLGRDAAHGYRGVQVG